MSTVNPLWDEYIMWSLSSDVDKGICATETDWALAHNTTTRTLRRWKLLPTFVARKEELEKVVSVSRVADMDLSDLTGDEGDYRIVKSTLIQGAKTGNPKFLELYFKTYGKEFVEEEVASRVSDIAAIDLDKLILESILAIGESVVVDSLRSLGWQVAK
jgi:hypothetical protein